MEGSRRRLPWIVAGAVATLLGPAGVVVLRADNPPAVVVRPEVTRPAVTPVRVPTGFERSAAVLNAQAAALLAGDEKGWLAALDPDRPKLRERYRAIFRNLRALDVTQLEFHADPRTGSTDRAVAVRAHLAYCLSAETCPAWQRDRGSGPPRITLDLNLKQVAGRYVITAMSEGAGQSNDLLQPTPWQNDELSVARGRRVTVAGPRSQAGNLAKVLAAAEKAAAVTDRFAAYLANPQRRYRVYLADEKAWKTWYGGSDRKWWVGYALPLGSAGSDVVLRASKLLNDPEQLAITVQHELGHVATLSGVVPRSNDDGWLAEGIAEYIGAYPKPARSSHSRYGMRNAVGGKAPRSIVSEPLAQRSSTRSVDAFYSLGHFAAACMAEKYGERRLFAFVDLVLRQGRDTDEASRTAYGRPFAAVDRTCVSWIRKQVSG